MGISFKKALVTGGAGFIGSHIVDALIGKGCDVIVIDNLSTGHMSNLEHTKGKMSFCQGDIRDIDFIMKKAEGCDVIFHQAAVVSVPLTVEKPVDSAMVNEIGTIHVLEAARKNHVKKVVLASSCAVYGDDPEIPKNEEMVARPQTPYAAQKYSNEQYARIYNQLYGMNTACLRYFNVYGPRQDPSSPYSGVISIFMTRAAKGESPLIYGDGRQFRDFVFVKDVVHANLLAAGLEKSDKNVFNIGTGSYIRINKLWDMVCRLSGASIEAEYAPPRAGDILESVANIDNAKKILGFEPEYAFEKGIEKTFEWYRNQPQTERRP